MSNQCLELQILNSIVADRPKPQISDWLLIVNILYAFSQTTRSRQTIRILRFLAAQIQVHREFSVICEASRYELTALAGIVIGQFDHVRIRFNYLF